MSETTGQSTVGSGQSGGEEARVVVSRRAGCTGVSAAARKLGITREYMCAIAHGRIKPGRALARRIAATGVLDGLSPDWAAVPAPPSPPRRPTLTQAERTAIGKNQPAVEEEYFRVADKDYRRFRDIERAAVYVLGWIDAALSDGSRVSVRGMLDSARAELKSALKT